MLPATSRCGNSTPLWNISPNPRRWTGTPVQVAAVPSHPASLETLLSDGILTRHSFHGEWNYTLHPLPAAPNDTLKTDRIN